MGAAKRKEENVIRVLKNMLQLMDKGNPAMFFWLDKGKMQYFGSKNTLDYFETKMDTTLKESIHAVMMADLLNHSSLMGHLDCPLRIAQFYCMFLP